jgi:predicted Zn-dependent peptidase
MSNIIRFTLQNGIEVVHLPADSPIAHCGLFINAGSRDELPEEQGLAHFTEHMLFKGTKHRKPYHILSRLDSVGGEINAFTSKEETCVYASFLTTYYQRAVDLIFDIVFYSTYPEKEMKKERDVILEEIESYKDNPSEQIFDDFEDMVFAGHPIGRNILGTPKSVEGFTPEDIRRFVARNYRPEQMVFVSIGNIGEKKLRKYIEMSSPKEHRTTPPVTRTPLTGYKPGHIILNQDTHQTHIILGNRAYAANHDHNLSFLLLNNLLGGPGLNNRLNLNIREKHGFTYHVESFYNAYSDTGIFGVYIGTDSRHINQSLRLIERELKQLREKKLGVLQLHRAKKQLMGQMFLQQDSHLNLMLNLGKSMLLFGKLEPWKKLADRLESITAENLLEVANDVFEKGKLSKLVYKEK